MIQLYHNLIHSSDHDEQGALISGPVPDLTRHGLRHTLNVTIGEMCEKMIQLYHDLIHSVSREKHGILISRTSSRWGKRANMPTGAGIFQLPLTIFLLASFTIFGATTDAAKEQVVPNAPKPITKPSGISPEERLRIEQAVPRQAVVAPRKPRKLLIFELNVNYGGHPSIRHASEAFNLMGEKTRAFQTVISRDPAIFKPESLRQFDAVFFNNTVGNLFTDPQLRQSLVEFVYGGGGLLGVHGTSVAFTQWPGAREDWPEFGLMIGARGANHRDSDEHVFIKLDDPDHPLNRVFSGRGFDYRDDFFRVHAPYSRSRVRVLFSIDNEKTEAQGVARGNVMRADNDYALAWVRSYGRGRTFYCTIAHNPYVFWDPKMLQFYLAAIQFALGDLQVPTLPSSKLTPAVRAQEKLGWRLGMDASTFGKQTLFEAIDKAAQLGLSYLGASSPQKVSQGIPKDFNDQLTDDELKQIRLKLDAAGVRLLTYYLPSIPSDQTGARTVFEFGRKIGIETIVSEPRPEALDTLEKLCDEYDINLALASPDKGSSPSYGSPQQALQACRNRSKRIGVCGDLGHWRRSGIDPLEAIGALQDRLSILQVRDLGQLSRAGGEVPLVTVVGKTELILKEIQRLGLKPAMFGLQYTGDAGDEMVDLARCIDFFDATCIKLAK